MCIIYVINFLRKNTVVKKFYSSFVIYPCFLKLVMQVESHPLKHLSVHLHPLPCKNLSGMIQLLPGISKQKTGGLEEPLVPQFFFLFWLLGWSRPLVHGSNFMPSPISEILGYPDRLSCVFLRNKGTMSGVALPSAWISLITGQRQLGVGEMLRQHSLWAPRLFCLSPGVLSILCFGSKYN